MVDGGKATPGPPLGPALGPMGVNVVQVVAKINEKTKSFEGMKVPVMVIIDPKTKSFDVKVGTPPTSQLLLKELGAEKGSGTPNKSKAGSLTMDQAIKVAKMKGDSLMGKNLKMQVLEVVGVCVSTGINVEGKDAKVMQKEIKEGKWDAKLGA
ncbi:MAG: 50S ribosomal protein L11 [Methanomassiliicoccales archaeon]|nr:50S ribosomal protein L11 [Methanomassiliicoccales archaeon]